jgi:hypothetical protein
MAVLDGPVYELWGDLISFQRWIRMLYLNISSMRAGGNRLRWFGGYIINVVLL